jgi:pRiA4b ORF-3-like protein
MAPPDMQDPGVIIELGEQLDFLRFVMADLQMSIAGQSLSDLATGSQKSGAAGSKRSSTKRSKGVSGTPSYQLKVTLHHSKPLIWRRLVVSGDISLNELHDVLQVSMGWDDSHLHDFRNQQNRYGDPTLLEEVIDESKTCLCQVAPRKGNRFIYTYDFGDNWEHDVLVEEIDRSSASAMSRCIGGRNACPPEDCGGVFGYLHLLESRTDTNHPNHDEAREWVDDDFDPKRFDAAAINSLLMKLG